MSFSNFHTTHNLVNNPFSSDVLHDTFPQKSVIITTIIFKLIKKKKPRHLNTGYYTMVEINSLKGRTHMAVLIRLSLCLQSLTWRPYAVPNIKLGSEGTISCHRDWCTSQRMRTSRAGGDAEKKELLFTASGNAV